MRFSFRLYDRRAAILAVAASQPWPRLREYQVKAYCGDGILLYVKVHRNVTRLPLHRSLYAVAGVRRNQRYHRGTRPGRMHHSLAKTLQMAALDLPDLGRRFEQQRRLAVLLDDAAAYLIPIGPQAAAKLKALLDYRD